MKQDEQVELVPPTEVEIDYIHDAIGLLQEVQGFLPLLTLDKLNSRVVKFTEDDRDLILGDAEFLIVMLVESVILVESATLRAISLIIAVAPL